MLMLPPLTAIAAPSNLIEMGICVLQLGVISGSYTSERTEPTLYSKFASFKEDKLDSPVSSRNGMLIIYVPAMLVGAAFTFITKLHDTAVAPLLLLHFLKRNIEVLGLHKYSGKMPFPQAIVIGTYYSLVTLLVALSAVGSGTNDTTWMNIGYTLFGMGQVGNLYHHYLLSTLRRNGESNLDPSGKRYVAPQGGLFTLVATPHYFFELVAWLGIACVAQQTNAFLVFAGMGSYLCGRAKTTSDWYMETFTEKEWDRSKKAIVPFVF
jgi:very-long-chain enoyl-CoA reductase